MLIHTVQLKVMAPTDISNKRGAALLDRLIGCGLEDAHESIELEDHGKR